MVNKTKIKNIKALKNAVVELQATDYKFKKEIENVKVILSHFYCVE